MKTIPSIVFATVLLAGCQTDQVVVPPPVTVSGPTFAASQFDCGKRPLAPDLAAIDPAHQASAALRFHNALGTWGQHCQNQLTALGAQLQAAGQVVAPALRGAQR